MRTIQYNIFILFLLILINSILSVEEITIVQVEVNTTTGLVYFIIVLFFVLNFCTPVGVWVYANYLSVWVEKATKEARKIRKRLSERLSDAGRRVNQSIRSN